MKPRVDTVGSQLEALRLDVMQGRAEEALPTIEAHLAEVRSWWARSRQGEPVAEAPDPVVLGRVLVRALNIASQAEQSLERWTPCLALLGEIIETRRALGEPEHEVARDRFNTYGPLLRLGKLDEAERELRGCLEIFREVDDLRAQSQVLSALADLRNRRGDHAQAAALERQALSRRDRLDDPAGRAISHGNLCTYLLQAGEAEEAARHDAAALVYDLVTGYQQWSQVDLHDLAIRIRRAAAQGRRYELPRVAELVARPEFEPLRRFLEERGEDVGEVQAAIDELAKRAGGE